MSITEPYRLALDFRYNNTNNAISGEVHTLDSETGNRIIVPVHGAFYTDSLVIYDENSGQQLDVETHYVPVLYYQEPSEVSGYEVCSAIAITSDEVSDTVRIDYHAVGGQYALIMTPLLDLVDQLDLEGRQVKWGDLFDKPSAFPPAPHFHDFADVYGLDDIVYQLQNVTDAIRNGDRRAFDARIEAVTNAAARRAQEEILSKLREGRNRAMLMSLIFGEN